MTKCNVLTKEELDRYAENRKKWPASKPHKVFPPKPGPIENPDIAYKNYRDQQREDALKWAENKKPQ